jgi:hypothetical protein
MLVLQLVLLPLLLRRRRCGPASGRCRSRQVPRWLLLLLPPPPRCSRRCRAAPPICSGPSAAQLCGRPGLPLRPGMLRQIMMRLVLLIEQVLAAVVRRRAARLLLARARVRHRCLPPPLILLPVLRLQLLLRLLRLLLPPLLRLPLGLLRSPVREHGAGAGLPCDWQS